MPGLKRRCGYRDMLLGFLERKWIFEFGIINRELSCCFTSIEKRSDPKQKINDPGCDQQLTVLV